MSFRNTDIEHTSRHLGLHGRYRRTRRHSSRYSHNLVVLACQFEQSVAKHVLIFKRLARLGVAFGTVAGSHVETSRCMPRGRVGLGGRVALALHGTQVQYARPFHIPDIVEHLHNGAYVVAVEGTEITYVQPLEDILLLRQQRLQAVVETQQRATAPVAHKVELLKTFECLVSHIVVYSGSVDMRELRIKGSDIAVDAHIVVVQHYQQIVRSVRGIVDTLEGKAAAYRGVADYGHHVAPGRFALKLRGHSHTERRRYGIGGVARRECVIIAFGRIREAAQASERPVCRKRIATPGEQLVAVSLMPHVPHNAVVRCVEHIMQSHRKLHCAHA